jgi:hypothetical protein
MVDSQSAKFAAAQRDGILDLLEISVTPAIYFDMLKAEEEKVRLFGRMSRPNHP